MTVSTSSTENVSPVIDNTKSTPVGRVEELQVQFESPRQMQDPDLSKIDATINNPKSNP